VVLNSPFCADVPLGNYSLTHSKHTHIHINYYDMHSNNIQGDCNKIPHAVSSFCRPSFTVTQTYFVSK